MLGSCIHVRAGVYQEVNKFDAVNVAKFRCDVQRRFWTVSSTQIYLSPIGEKELGALDCTVLCCYHQQRIRAFVSVQVVWRVIGRGVEPTL